MPGISRSGKVGLRLIVDVTCTYLSNSTSNYSGDSAAHGVTDQSKAIIHPRGSFRNLSTAFDNSTPGIEAIPGAWEWHGTFARVNTSTNSRAAGSGGSAVVGTWEATIEEQWG